MGGWVGGWVGSPAEEGQVDLLIEGLEGSFHHHHALHTRREVGGWVIGR